MLFSSTFMMPLNTIMISLPYILITYNAWKPYKLDEQFHALRPTAKQIFISDIVQFNLLYGHQIFKSNFSASYVASFSNVRNGYSESRTTIQLFHRITFMENSLDYTEKNLKFGNFIKIWFTTDRWFANGQFLMCFVASENTLQIKAI